MACEEFRLTDCFAEHLANMGSKSTAYVDRRNMHNGTPSGQLWAALCPSKTSPCQFVFASTSLQLCEAW